MDKFRDKRQRLFRACALLGAFLIGLTGIAWAEEDDAECYDALVYGRILSHNEQIGSLDGIIPKWYSIWIVDLKVKRTLYGDTGTGVIKVQRISHGITKPWDMFWALRRNDQNGYSIVQGSYLRDGLSGFDIGRCPKGTPPMKAYKGK